MTKVLQIMTKIRETKYEIEMMSCDDMKGELVEAKVRILGELGSGSKIDGNIEKELNLKYH
jgi:hypothetical protein